MDEQYGRSDEEIARCEARRAALAAEDPLAEQYGTDDAPLDLSSVQADDALLTALGQLDPGTSALLPNHELSALLLSWRREVDSEPCEHFVDVDTAVATIAASTASRRRRHHFLVPLASAAAVLAIAFTGVGMAARDAQPGDALWGLSRVLYSEHARSVEAASSVRSDLDNARLALRDGRIADAKNALARAQATLGAVAGEDGQADLVAKHESLSQQLSASPQPGGSVTMTSVANPPPVLSTRPSTTTTNPPKSTTTTTTTTAPPSGSTTGTTTTSTTVTTQGSTGGHPSDGTATPRKDNPGVGSTTSGNTHGSRNTAGSGH